MFYGRIIPEDNTSLDPFINLATEQSILFHHTDLNTELVCTTRFWRNEKVVIVGRNQELEKEVNEPFCRKKAIKICRRISGGGTVYQDEGNLNISIFIRKSIIKNKISHNLKTLTLGFTHLVRDTLEEGGLDNITVLPPSSILHQGYKVSGSAGYQKSNWILHHFTLLLNSDLNNLEQSLLARPGYAIQSSRASNYYKTKNLPSTFDLANWKKKFIEELGKRYNITFKEQKISKTEQQHAELLSKSMYKTHEWIYDQIRTDTMR